MEQPNEYTLDPKELSIVKELEAAQRDAQVSLVATLNAIRRSNGLPDGQWNFANGKLTLGTVTGGPTNA